MLISEWHQNADDDLAGYRIHQVHYFAQFLVFALWKHLQPSVAPDATPGWPDWLRPVIAGLEQKDEPPPALQELIRRSGRCHEHFTRQFRRCLGVAPAHYLAGRKIERAASLLVTTNHKLLEGLS